jgi:hypothetical protein
VKRERKKKKRSRYPRRFLALNKFHFRINENLSFKFFQDI